MKILIAGAGMSGSYLYRRLGDRFDVDIVDRAGAKLGCSCGFGTEIRPFSGFMKKIGVDAEDYILTKIKKLDFQSGMLVCNTDNFCTIDKIRLIKDLVGKAVRCDTPKFGDYDMIIDATGSERAFLPPVKGDLHIETRQSRIVPVGGGVGDTAYISFVCIGYGWDFPLGNTRHVGFGDIMVNNYKFILKNYSTVVCDCTSKIRLLPPEYCQPIVRGKVWGVGESIGCVSPISGEGIIPSLRCAEILCKHLRPSPHYEGPDMASRAGYVTAVQREFRWMVDEYKAIQHFLHGRRRRGILKFLRCFKNGKRFGIKFRYRDIFKVLKIVKQWSGGAIHARRRYEKGK